MNQTPKAWSRNHRYIPLEFRCYHANKARIYVISYALQVSGRHLLFHTHKSDNIRTVVLSDPWSMGIAVGNSLLLCVSFEICSSVFLKPPSFWFRLLQSIISLLSNTSVLSVHENCKVAVGILFLASVERKIYCMLQALHTWYLLLPVFRRHIAYHIMCIRTLKETI